MTTLKKPENGFQDQILLNAGLKYCILLQGEHSAILLTFIKLPFVIKIFVLSILSGRFTQYMDLPRYSLEGNLYLAKKEMLHTF